ncbi:uncharacterized protein LOC126833258 isoform X4 [Adelges cooleyi]|nr:uncharacterized protein LOC126833258 isoform X4 [Adelges cooleyi]XP_050420439.1 uncharacterized protein LOC126833258 isoform X4 [Adelges cooleyi]XP_050420442.1 uncharacterized protein LOC126833258 isoform X4 [Adelges cooleyi]XP_050420443.1 uncharacterized protein LOC126833258 isoform X4 [Adelges cooleyi]
MKVQYFVATTFIWLVSWTAALDIPYEDLNNPNKICQPQSSCTVVKPSSSAESDEDFASNCLCDKRCAEYGDCCTDSAFFDPVKQLRAPAQYRCVSVGGQNVVGDGGSGVYMKASCPPEWTDKPVRSACEQPDENATMMGNPVTVGTTGVTYRNRYCALCNSDTKGLVIWDTRLRCQNFTENVTVDADAIANSLTQQSDGQWTVEYLGKTYECKVEAVPQPSSRPCITNMVTSCHTMWPNDEIKSNCEAYTTVVYEFDQPYKNIHCAICNHVPVQKLKCNKSNVQNRFNIDFTARSLGTLFLAKPGHRRCRADTFYDPFGKTCRPLVPSGLPQLNCTKVAMYTQVTPGWQPGNGTIDYVLLDNGTMAVCAEDAAIRAEPLESLKSVVLTYVGLGVSTVFLIIHLAVFTVLPEMKNLSGKNLASFSVSLIFAYAAFVTGNWLTGVACYVDATLTYYLFLASFAWMLIMSFDCWRTLRLATVELRVSSGRQTKKFLIYSAICWLVPAMIAFVAVLADTTPGVPEHLRPKFGADQCWFGGKTALLVFFAGPLTAVMFINFVLFLWTTYMIHMSRCTSRHVSTRHVRRDFRMYCRLAVLMGLTWSAGIVANYFDSKHLWVLFVVLNAFQGLFVFAAFTCRRRYLNSLVGNDNDFDKDDKKKNHVTSIRHPPPSFSWSSSADSSVPVSAEKTSSETLY